jgi:protocatechuate 3,4-dioxygenase alpha subunit
MNDDQESQYSGQTPEQTIGPFFHFALPWRGGADLVGGSDMGARPELFPDDRHALNRSPSRGPIAGDAIEIFGRVLDGEGKVVPDALIEIWQADAEGRYPGPRTAHSNDPGFPGFGRAATGEDGSFRFRTVRPGPVAARAGVLQAPHIAVGIFGRGLLKRLVTRIYFAGVEANDTDPILALVPEERRTTLMAVPENGGWRFDIVLQGARETVFFAC